MKGHYFAILIFTFGFVTSCNDDPDSDQPNTAMADIYSINQNADSTYVTSNEFLGTAVFVKTGESVKLDLTLNGLTPNYLHAIHLHMGSCEVPGHHWNRMDTSNYCRVLDLGAMWGRPKAGDVGNITTDSNGSGKLSMETELWDVNSYDDNDIVGAVMVIHANGEDFAQECFADHNHVHNNPKIACGSIELIVGD